MYICLYPYMYISVYTCVVPVRFGFAFDRHSARLLRQKTPSAGYRSRFNACIPNRVLSKDFVKAGAVDYRPRFSDCMPNRELSNSFVSSSLGGLSLAVQ